MNILENITNYVLCKIKGAITSDENDNIAIRIEPSDTTKISNSQLMCVMVNILTELKIMNSHLSEMTGDDKNIDDLD